MLKKKLPPFAKQYEPWSTLFIEPLVIYLTPRLAKLKIHPNLITIFTAILGLAAGLLYALGHWICAPITYLATYIPDCLDGKVARYRQMNSEFGAKLDNWADYCRKPLSFLGIAVYFCLHDHLLFAFFTALALAAHFYIHRLYVLTGIQHYDLEFPTFHRKVFRRIMPRALALYTFFEEQNLLFVAFPLTGGIIGLPDGAVWFFYGAITATILVTAKLLIVLRHRRQGRYDIVHQNWGLTIGMLDEQNRA